MLRPTFSFLLTSLIPLVLWCINFFLWGGFEENKECIRKLRMGCETKSMGGGLVFRDFEGFNLALLTKQYWRIINSPSSLVVVCLRAKNFPNGNFLVASLGHRPLLFSLISWREEIFSP